MSVVLYVISTGGRNLRSLTSVRDDNRSPAIATHPDAGERMKEEVFGGEVIAQRTERIFSHLQ
jgi:hypothetical protein